jgi:hypothetical protein
VLQLYEHATALLKQGTWVICTDEKTSIQAREAEQAPRPAMPNHPVYQSSRYHRRGALHLMAAFSAADGLVYGQCHPRKRFVDFRSFLETIVIAEAHRRGVQKVALVLDNGPTHASKQLPGFVEELARASEGKLTMQLYWLPVNASWLDQIEIWFSLLQRKLLQPNHFTNLHELEQAIQDFILHYRGVQVIYSWKTNRVSPAKLEQVTPQSKSDASFRSKLEQVIHSSNCSSAKLEQVIHSSNDA